jgi:hydroxymethylpyrimidine/phosphomethylpyrimidine kinase
MPPPIILSIAGYDPSSGAGVTADVQTILAHACFPITCITALTVQTTQGVKKVEPVRGEIVRDTLRELAKDFTIAAVRIGMLGSGEVAKTVADFLLSSGLEHIVLDPILKSSSGADLIDEPGQNILRERLLPLCEVITPNLMEAEALIRGKVRDRHDVHGATRKLHALGVRNVVITGGHFEHDASDVLSMQGRIEEFYAPKIESRSTHGTGCAFATAIACELAQGKQLREAVIAAKKFVRGAIENAVPLGKGPGPLKLI